MKTPQQHSTGPVYPPVTLRDILIVVFKFKVLILSTFVITVFTTLIALWMKDPAYEAETRILIKYGRDAATNPRASISSNPTRIAANARPDVNSEVELLKSYWMAEHVVTELHLDAPKPKQPPPELAKRLRFELKRLSKWGGDLLDEVQFRLALKERLSPREKAITEVLESLTVEGVKESSIVDVKLRTKFKQGAGLILNRLVAHYRETRLAIERSPDVETFFKGQADGYRKNLKRSEDALIKLKERAEISSLPENLGLANRALVEAEQSLSEAGARLAEAEAQVVLLQKQLSGEKPRMVLDEVSGRNTLLDTLTEQRATLLLERGKLAGKVVDEDPRLADMSRQIADVDRLIASAEKEVERTRTTGENSIYTELRKSQTAALRIRDAARARYEAQAEILAARRARLHQLQSLEGELSQLSREVDLNAENYRLFERSAAEMKSAEALNAAGITSISIIDPAVDPIVPTGTRRSYIFGGALAGGLLLGFGLAFMLETMDRTVSRPEHVLEILPPPVLGNFLLKPKADLGMPPRGQLLDEARSLACRIDAELATRSGRIVALMGATRGSGVSTVSGLLAHVYGGDPGRRTLLLRVRREGAEFSHSGIEDPAGEGLVCRELRLPEHLRADRITRAWLEAEGDIQPFDRTILDITSSISRDRQIAFARISDAAVVVIDSERSRKDVIMWLKAELERADVPLLGGLLNKRRYHIPEFVYRWL